MHTSTTYSLPTCSQGCNSQESNSQGTHSKSLTVESEFSAGSRGRISCLPPDISPGFRKLPKHYLCAFEGLCVVSMVRKQYMKAGFHLRHT